MPVSKPSIAVLTLAATLAISGCVTTGTASTAAKGAAAGATAVNADSGLERCEVPLGTLLIDDDREKDWYGEFTRATKITSIEPLIRLTVMQSNCFVITATGNKKTEEKIRRITELQRNSEEFRANSNQQAGQRVATDYLLETAIVINNEQVSSMKTGAEFGANAGLGGLIIGGLAGSLMANIEKKQSVVTMSLFDIRSGVQLAMSEGNSTATNYSAALDLLGGNGAGSISGFSRTPEGKASVAAFVDSYNGMVIALRNYKMQQVKGGLGRGGQLTVAE